MGDRGGLGLFELLDVLGLSQRRLVRLHGLLNDFVPHRTDRSVKGQERLELLARFQRGRLRLKVRKEFAPPLYMTYIDDKTQGHQASSDQEGEVGEQSHY